MTRLEQLITDARRLADGSKRVYLAGVRRFIAFAGAAEASWTPAKVDEWHKAESERIAPQSANKGLAGVKWASARRAALDGKPDFAAAVEAWPEGDAVRRARSLTVVEARHLLTTCPLTGTPIDIRDHVILLLGLRLGLRRHEIAAVSWGAFDLGKSRLIVRGKGGKTVELPVDERLCAALRKLLAVTPMSFQAPAYTIVQRAKRGLHGQPKDCALSPHGIYKIVKTRAQQANIENMGPHTLRHTFASLALLAGADPWRVMKATRHADLQTLLTIYAHDLKAEGGEPIGDAVSRMLDGDDDNEGEKK